jgi:hypothetical protein
MTLEQFGRLIGRPLVVQEFPCGKKTYWRCYFENVVYADPALRGIAETLIGTGPSRERAKRDLARQVRGRAVRVKHCFKVREFDIPLAITA